MVAIKISTFDNIALLLRALFPRRTTNLVPSFEEEHVDKVRAGGIWASRCMCDQPGFKYCAQASEFVANKKRVFDDVAL